MAESRVRIGGDGPLSPDDVARKSFPTTRRGFDPVDVRQFLEAVAAELRRLRERLHEFERRPADEPAPSSVSEEPASPPPLDIATLTSALGAETARVLRTAQEAAVDLRARAEEGAARALTEAHDEAARVRAQAEGLLAQRTEEADAMASKLRAEVESEVAGARTRAEAEAEAKIQAAVERGREMVGEAQAARERMLVDLARRRKTALTQLEQLRAGRERLLEAYRAVRRSLDDITDELTRADAEANLAADAAGRRVHAEQMSSEHTSDDGVLAESSALAGFPPSPRGAEQDFGAETSAPAAPESQRPDAQATSSAPPPPTPAATVIPAPVATPPPSLPASPTSQGDAIPVATLPDYAVGPPSDASPAGPAAAPSDSPDDSPAGSAPGPTGVDQLFARIRADRAETTVKARETLAETPMTTASAAAASEGAASVATAVKSLPVAPAVPAAEATATGPAEATAQWTSTTPAEATATTPAEATATTPAEVPTAGASTTPAEVRTAGASTTPAEVRTAGASTTASAKGDEIFLQRRDALIEPLATSLTKKIKRQLAHEQNVVLDRLRTHRGKLTVDAILPEHGTHAAPYVEAVVGVLEEGDLAGATLAGAIGPVAGAEAGGADLSGLQTLAEGLAAELLGPLRQRLERAMGEGAADDPVVAGDVVRSAYRELKSVRIERVVLDRLTGAVTLGIHRALPAGTMVCWLVDDADGACPDCDDNALAGPTALGEPFPTGQLGPPAHPGCRCLLGPAPA